MTDTGHHTSLANAMVRMATIVAVVTVFVATVVSCFVLYGIFKEQKLAEIVRHVEDRARTQQQLFDQVNAINRNAIASLSERLMYASVEQSVIEFDELFPLQPDGSRRSAPELFDGFVHADGEMIQGIGAFMRAGQPISDEDKHVLVTAYHVVRHVGPVASPQFDNFWFYTPNDQLIIYAPDREDELMYYRQNAPAATSFQDRIFAQHGRVARNPKRTLSCTDLSNIMYDSSGRTLTSGCLIPFDQDGEFVGAFGTSMLLNSWLNEAIAPTLDYATPILVTEEGNIIAHPDLISDDPDRLTLAEHIAHELNLKKIAASAESAGAGKAMATYKAVNGHYIASRKIEGPGWILLLAVKQNLIFAQTIQLTLKIVLLGMVSSFIGLFILRGLLIRKVTRPLIELQKAAVNATSREHLTTSSLIQRTDEVGDLARALSDRDKRFQRLVDSLEIIVQQRTGQLMRREKKLEQLNESLRDFSFIVSHDLQAPLRHSEAFVSILREEMDVSGTALSPDGVEALEVIETSSQRMRSMVKSLYELSSLDVREIERVPVNLNRIIEVARDQVSSLLTETGARLEADSLPYIMGVEQLLVQVFQNLMANACKYSAGSRPVMRVYLAKSEDENICRIIFEDEGTGIPEKFHNKVFQPFQRLVSGDDIEGSGIGLALCRKILHRHNGEISIDATYSRGTRFVMTLQRATSNADQETPGQSQNQDAAA